MYRLLFCLLIYQSIITSHNREINYIIFNKLNQIIYYTIYYFSKNLNKINLNDGFT